MPKNGKSGRGGSTQFTQQLESAVTAPPLVGCVLWSRLGPCQPGLKDNVDSFPKDEDGRHFIPTWYKKKMKNGCEIDRHWLVYSPRENYIIFIPCFFLVNRANHWSDPKNWLQDVC